MGTRLGLGPKAFLSLNGAPLIHWVTRKALCLSDDIVVSAPPEAVVQMAEYCPGCRCVAGGETRQESIARLLEAVKREWILILDVCRPFTSTTMMQNVLIAAQKTGVAAAFLPIPVPVAVLREGKMVQSFRRDETGLFQTPQAYSRPLLLQLMADAQKQGWQEQSILQLLIRAGGQERIGVVPDEPTNIKITTPLDWQLASLLIDHL
ncbi:MAG: 2-C-methyl-D-erythritol 4-phosphate cytidylyltransferase [Magnetococcales bacterium]|nr:2-C-methyl-D-erythritol 4-phosphate cytidylyltransferase [Magnetococcales bacterium]